MDAFQASDTEIKGRAEQQIQLNQEVGDFISTLICQNELSFDNNDNDDQIDAFQVSDNVVLDTEKEEELLSQYLDFQEKEGRIGAIIPDIVERQIQLNQEVADFISTLICQNELSFYRTIINANKSPQDILSTHNKMIIEMIKVATCDIYNKLYDELRAFMIPMIPSKNLMTLNNLAQIAGYPAHSLLAKLFNLQFQIHIDINRFDLNFMDIRSLHYTILNQINVILLTTDLTTPLAQVKGDFDPPVELPPGQQAFNIDLKFEKSN